MFQMIENNTYEGIKFFKVLIPLFRSMFQMKCCTSGQSLRGCLRLNPFIQVYVSNYVSLKWEPKPALVSLNPFIQVYVSNKNSTDRRPSHCESVLIPLFRSMFQIIRQESLMIINI